MSKAKIKAKEFDAKFEAGEDIHAHVDWKKAKVVAGKSQRVNVDFPGWIVKSLDEEASRLGITRQSLIKVWIAEKLQKAV